MGASFSINSNRRRNPPPPHYYYSSNAIFHPSPPQPYYSSVHPYNHLIPRYSYPQQPQPYFYGGQPNNGWRAPPPPPAVDPASYVEHQDAKKVRNDVIVHKGASDGAVEFLGGATKAQALDGAIELLEAWALDGAVRLLGCWTTTPRVDGDEAQQTYYSCRTDSMD